MSTNQEIGWGRGIAREIVGEQGALDDPLLVRWVGTVGGRLIAHTVRADVPYTVTIVNSEEVNAFSVPGGFIFIDAGLLNFVHSDDELAAVIAHEIGHVERRHIVTLSQKAKALEIILDVAGIFAPGVTRFGNLAGDLILLKLSRVDELQADQYGLKLMSQAGYDPEGMASFLDRLQTIHPEHRSLLGRYFETHPALPDRVAHVRGYAELDRPAAGALLAQAIHDDASAQYFTARQKVAQVLKSEPGNALAQSYARKLNAVFAAPQGPKRPWPPTSVDRALADFALAGSRADAAAVKERVKLATKELDEYSKYLNYLGFYVDAQSRMGIPRGSRLDRILSGQARISQAMDHNYDQVSETVAQVSDLADGDVKLLGEIRTRMDHPDAAAPLDAAQFSLLLQRCAAAHRDFLRAADAARGAMAVGWESGKVIKSFLDKFDQVSDYKGGDMKAADYYRLQPSLRLALAAAKQAAKAGDLSATFLNDGESSELLDRIDMLTPGVTPARARSFDLLLAKRFNAPPGQSAAGLTAGELAAAAIISAEDGKPLGETVRTLRSTRAAPTDYAARMQVRAETLQLELGLVWLSYTDGRL
jgi:hypothetical protein